MKQIIRSSDLITSDMDDELVMLSINSGKYHAINAVGKRIWQLLERPMNLPQLCEALSSEFDVDAKRCTEETAGFVAQLFTHNLVKYHDDASMAST